jgi:hypothetical protein
MDALDRALAGALAVDPSPEYLARVRARIAHEPAPSSWRMARRALGGGAVAAVIVVAVAVARVDRTPAELPVQRSAAAIVAAPVAIAVSAARDAPVRRRHALRPPVQIQLVAIEDLPTAPAGDVVPSMDVSLVTMTGVHP